MRDAPSSTDSTGLVRRRDRIHNVTSVHARQLVPSALDRLAVLQAGVVSREQALGCGLSRHVIDRLTASEQWRPLARGIYLIAPLAPSWHSLAWAGVLLGGDDSRLGPRASGYLYRLLDREPTPIDILVPAARQVRTSGPWLFARERAGVRPFRTVGEPPRLTVETSVLDLCAAGTETDVVSLTTKAVQLRLTTTSRLRTALAERSRQRHRRLLQGILSDVAEGAESPLEVRYLREVERAHGLPKGRRQKSRAGLPYLTDVGYDEYGVLVELDGRAGHEGTGRFRDMKRDNAFAIRGFTTLRYGWFDLTEQSCAVARQIAAILVSRGWPGLLQPCDRCSRLNVID